MTSAEKITAVANGVRDLLLSKNKAYGDSALKPANVFAKGSAVENLCSRIDDKLMRIKNKGINAQHCCVMNEQEMPTPNASRHGRTLATYSSTWGTLDAPKTSCRNSLASALRRLTICLLLQLCQLFTTTAMKSKTIANDNCCF